MKLIKSAVALAAMTLVVVTMSACNKKTDYMYGIDIRASAERPYTYTLKGKGTESEQIEAMCKKGIAASEARIKAGKEGPEGGDDFKAYINMLDPVDSCIDYESRKVKEIRRFERMLWNVVYGGDGKDAERDISPADLYLRYAYTLCAKRNERDWMTPSSMRGCMAAGSEHPKTLFDFIVSEPKVE